MALMKILKLFKTKESLDYIYNNFKLIKTVYNKKECTKISHFQIINIGEKQIILSKLKNINETFLLPIYRITDHSVYTKKLVPYKFLLNQNISIEYKKYIFYKIKEALLYLHNNLNIEHVNLTTDSIFIDEMGNPLLGDIINFKIGNNVNLKQLDIVCMHETQQTINKLNGFEIFFTIEDFFKETDFIKTKVLINTIILKKNIIPSEIQKNIFNKLFEYLKKNIDKSEKLYIMSFLKQFDNNLFIKNQIEFFKIIDYNVRLFMLSELDSINNLDDCVFDISLGIRVKEKQMKMETLSFIFKYSDKFSKKSFALFLNTISECVVESDEIKLVCNKLLDENMINNTYSFINNSLTIDGSRKDKREIKDYIKILYKLLISFLKLKKCKKEVYICFAKYYSLFNKSKIASELLPILCNLLPEKEYQEELFDLVEQIVQWLKKNRNELDQSDWKLNKSKDKLINKSEKREKAFQNKINEIKKEIEKEYGTTLEKFSEDWEEQDI